MEDENTLFDYKININDVIQLMIKPDIIEPKTVDIATVNRNKNYTDNENETNKIFKTAKSDYYKVGDAVDCIDLKYGAWFEATIRTIYKNDEKLIYIVQWDLVKYAQPFHVEEHSIRPRAWKIIKESDLKIGQKVMINHNLDSPSEVGHWYDFEIKKIFTKRNRLILIGTLYIGK